MIIHKTIEADELRRMARDLMEFHVDLGTKADDGEGANRTFTGFASTGAVDRVGDIVEPAAFNRTFKKFMRGNPVLLGHHSPFIGIGHITDGEITDKGLKVAAKVGTGTNPLDDIEVMWNRISQRIYRAMSFGFRILKREDIVDDGRVTGWRILDLDLLEISVVAIPANAEALFNIGKAVQMGTDLDYDLYSRGLWNIPPRIVTVPGNDYDQPTVRPGRSLASFDARLAAIERTALPREAVQNER